MKRLYQYIEIPGKNLQREGHDRDKSKFWDGGKWDNFINPLLPEGCEDLPFLEIGSNYDWESVLKSNNLGKCSSKVKETLDIIKSIRRNIMFNRFFAIQDGYNTYKYSKFYPLSEKEKSVIIGFDVPYHMKLLKKDILECEKKLENIKEIVSLGQRKLK